MNVCKILIAIILLSSVAVAQNYSIDWYVIASGGGHSESENYGIDGTVGQAIVGQSESENYGVQSGFWAGGEPSGGDCVYVAGDCDHNGTPLELADVVAMIGMYRGTVVPQYECSCPPHGDTFTPTADPNGNCTANELSDAVTEIGAYRGSVTASGCIDCPGSGRLLPGGDRPLAMPRLKTKVKNIPKLTAD